MRCQCLYQHFTFFFFLLKWLEDTHYKFCIFFTLLFLSLQLLYLLNLFLFLILYNPELLLKPIQFLYDIIFFDIKLIYAHLFLFYSVFIFSSFHNGFVVFLLHHRGPYFKHLIFVQIFLALFFLGKRFLILNWCSLFWFYLNFVFFLIC